jgi:hypothetical protein
VRHDREGEATSGDRGPIRNGGQEALDYIVERRGRDPLVELLDNAPEDDEPTAPEEEEGVRDARADIERGEFFSAEEIKRELTRVASAGATSSPRERGETSSASTQRRRSAPRGPRTADW